MLDATHFTPTASKTFRRIERSRCEATYGEIIARHTETVFASGRVESHFVGFCGVENESDWIDRKTVRELDQAYDLDAVAAARVSSGWVEVAS